MASDSHQKELPHPRLAYRLTAAAQLLDCSRSTVYALARAGEIATIHVAGDMRITHTELVRFLAKREKKNAGVEQESSGQVMT